MVYPVNHVQLFDGDLINLVENVDAGYVYPIALDDVYEFVDSGITPEGDVCRVDPVLIAHGTDLVVINLSQGHGVGDIETAALLPFERDVWWCLVQADAEALQFVLDDFLVRQWFQDVEDDENQLCRPRGGNDLFSSTLAVLGALNDTRQIQYLNLGTFVVEHARNCRQGGKLWKKR